MSKKAGELANKWIQAANETFRNQEADQGDIALAVALVMRQFNDAGAQLDMIESVAYMVSGAGREVGE